jgi:hypothetical protein
MRHGIVPACRVLYLMGSMKNSNLERGWYSNLRFGGNAASSATYSPSLDFEMTRVNEEVDCSYSQNYVLTGRLLQISYSFNSRHKFIILVVLSNIVLDGPFPALPAKTELT